MGPAARAARAFVGTRGGGGRGSGRRTGPAFAALLLFAAAARAGPSIPQYRHVLANGDLEELPPVRWVQRIAGTKNDYFFDAIVKPEPALGQAAAPYPTSVFKGRATYHNIYVFAGYSSYLHREVWRYKGGMYNHTLGIWEDDFGVCDVEEVGSTCNTWQPVPYTVQLPRCSLDNDTCGASETNTTARGLAELARRDHTLVPIFTDELSFDRDGGLLLAFGGKNLQRTMNDLRVFSGERGTMACPALAFEATRRRKPTCHARHVQSVNVSAGTDVDLDSGLAVLGQRCSLRVTAESSGRVPELHISKLDVLAHYGCQNRFRVLEVPQGAASIAAEGALLFDSCEHKPEGVPVDEALLRANATVAGGFPLCGRRLSARAAGRDLVLLLEVNDACPGFGGFQATASSRAAPLEPAAASCASLPTVPPDYRLSPSPRAEHTAVVVYTSSTSKVVRKEVVINDPIVTETTAAATNQAAADIADLKSRIPNLKPNDEADRLNGLPREIQRFSCDRSELDGQGRRCFQMSYQGIPIPALVSPFAGAVTLKAVLESHPLLYDVDVTIEVILPRAKLQGGGCYVPNPDIGPNTYQQVYGCPFDGLRADPEVCVATGESLGPPNYVRLTFTNTSVCNDNAPDDPSFRRCDVPPLQIEWSDFEADEDAPLNCTVPFTSTAGFDTSSALLGFRYENGSVLVTGQSFESFKGVEPYKVTFLADNSTRYFTPTSREGSGTFTVKDDPYTSGNFSFREDTSTTETIVINGTTTVEVGISTVTSAAGKSEGYMRMLVFGGWNGTATASSSLWGFDFAKQPDESQRLASAVGGMNYDEEIHTAFPSLLSLSMWEKIATQGPPPPARYAHGAAVGGERGGVGAERYSMVLFGGRSQLGQYLNDTWELSLERQRAFHDYLLEVVVTCPDPAAVLQLGGTATPTYRHVISLFGANVSVSANSTVTDFERAFATIPNVTVVAEFDETDTLKNETRLCGALREGADASATATEATLLLRYRPFVFILNVSRAVDIVHLRNASLAAAMSELRQNASEGANVTSVDPGSGTTLYNDSTALVMDLRPRQIWYEQDAYVWRELLPSLPGTTAPAPRINPTLSSYNTTWGMTIVLVFGGWDSRQVFSDVWRMRRLTQRGLVEWTKAQDRRNGKWVTCWPNFWPIDWYGLNCGEVGLAGMPDRYLHKAVPLALTSNGTMGVAVMAGSSISNLPVGNNSNLYGLPFGGSAPDFFVLCDDSDAACAKLFATGASGALAPSLGVSLLVSIFMFLRLA